MSGVISGAKVQHVWGQMRGQVSCRFGSLMSASVAVISLPVCLQNEHRSSELCVRGSNPSRYATDCLCPSKIG